MCYCGLSSLQNRDFPFFSFDPKLKHETFLSFMCFLGLTLLVLVLVLTCTECGVVVDAQCDCTATVTQNPGLNRFVLGKVVGENDNDISMAMALREFSEFTFEEYMENYFSMGVPVIVTGVGSGGGKIFSIAGEGNPVDKQGERCQSPTPMFPHVIAGPDSTPISNATQIDRRRR
jgi:hypothetical protein